MDVRAKGLAMAGFQFMLDDRGSAGSEARNAEGSAKGNAEGRAAGTSDAKLLRNSAGAGAGVCAGIGSGEDGSCGGCWGGGSAKMEARGRTPETDKEAKPDIHETAVGAAGTVGVVPAKATAVGPTTVGDVGTAGAAGAAGALGRCGDAKAGNGVGHAVSVSSDAAGKASRWVSVSAEAAQPRAAADAVLPRFGEGEVTAEATRSLLRSGEATLVKGGGGGDCGASSSNGCVSEVRDATAGQSLAANGDAGSATCRGRPGDVDQTSARRTASTEWLSASGDAVSRPVVPWPAAASDAWVEAAAANPECEPSREARAGNGDA